MVKGRHVDKHARVHAAAPAAVKRHDVHTHAPLRRQTRTPIPFRRRAEGAVTARRGVTRSGRAT
jgi:hypothetical protein